MADLYRSKESGDSPRVTLGDPLKISNRESDHDANTLDHPQVPKKK